MNQDEPLTVKQIKEKMSDFAKRLDSENSIWISTGKPKFMEMNPSDEDIKKYDMAKVIFKQWDTK
jgi:hypothetical protein